MKFERHKDPREKMKIGQAALPVVIHQALKKSDEYAPWEYMGHPDIGFLLDIMKDQGVAKLPNAMEFTLVHVTLKKEHITYSPKDLIEREVHYNGESFLIKP